MPQIAPEFVDRHLQSKEKHTINGLQTQARQALIAGMTSPTEKRVQTLTLPTGTGKTMLAATWALILREKLSQSGPAPLIMIVLPFLSIIDQTATEYTRMFGQDGVDAGDFISYHSLSDRTFDKDLEDESQNFFLDTWQSSVVITTFDQFLMALLSPKARHQMRCHHLAGCPHHS